MYLPFRIPNARVLITVKTYPMPSHGYDELVCTAGLLDGDKWIRIYPVPFRFLTEDRQYSKYSWIEVDLLRKTSDFRPETYSFSEGVEAEDIKVVGKIDTRNGWAERSKYVLKEVFDSMTELIDLAKSNECKSLGTLKPLEITKFEIETSDDRWKRSWQNLANNVTIFDEIDKSIKTKKNPIPKLPFKYYYHFFTKGDDKPRRLQIEDWEIGALFWNCLKRCEGDAEEANKLVRQMYFDEFANNKDLHFFLGSTLQFHRRKAKNPFMIIGVYYPPPNQQLIFS